MKFIIGLCVMMAFIAVESLYTSPARICVIQVNTCNSDVAVCGRYGRSNLCKKFRNNCALQTANCADSVGYTAVNATRCRGIALNQRGMCNGIASSTGGILSNLLGTNSNSNVQPIIINTGK